MILIDDTKTWQGDNSSVASELGKMGEGEEEKDQWDHSFLNTKYTVLKSHNFYQM